MISLCEFTDDELKPEGGDDAKTDDHAGHDNDAFPEVVLVAQKIRHAVFDHLQVRCGS